MLFKPTKSTKNPFRPTGEEAMSYFVGAEAMNAPQFEGEDAGFAINGGKGWKSVSPWVRVRVGVRVRVRVGVGVRVAPCRLGSAWGQARCHGRRTASDADRTPEEG